MKEEYFNTIEEFMETRSAKKLMCSAIKEILPDKNNWFGFAISLLLAFVIAPVIGFSSDSVNMFVDSLGTLIGIQLGIFGCVFTIYSIILAFLSDGYMQRLSKIPGSNKKSFLEESTTYYESVLFLYFINIGLTGALQIICKCLPVDFRLTSCFCFDCVLATILSLLYFLFSFRVFYEIKSTIYNTIVLFRASIAYRFIDFCIKDSDAEENHGNK